MAKRHREGTTPSGLNSFPTRAAVEKWRRSTILLGVNMIAFGYNEVGLSVGQQCSSCTIYLDHWAWRKISVTEPVANRFSAALKRRNGTIALSWLNVAEFSQLTGKYSWQARNADALLKRILPHVFIINPDFFKVIDEENLLLAGGAPSAPHADKVFLKAFVKSNLQQGPGLELLSEQNIFQLGLTSGIATKYDRFGDVVAGRIDSLRKDYENNAEFRRVVDRIPRGAQIQRGTRFIARELLRSFCDYKQMKVTRQHAIDVCHAVVPIAYCDYVLLDAHWKTQARRAQERITKGSVSFPIAKVFSENEMEGFLQELESAPERVSSAQSHIFGSPD